MNDDIALHPRLSVHTITVTRIAYENPPDSVGIEPTDLSYTIAHGPCLWRGEDCLVESTVIELGLHAAMYGVWDKDNRLELGDYRVRGWTSKHDIPGEPVEYDAGIEEVEDDDE